MFEWSEHKIAELRARAINKSLRSFDRNIAKSKLLALDGNQAAAKALLIRATADRTSQAARPERTEELIAAAIITGLFDLATRLIRQYQTDELTIDIAIAKNASYPTTAVGWEIEGAATSRFTFDPYIFQLDHTEFFIHRWVRTLPLLLRYLRFPSFETGRVCLSLDDHGTVTGLAYCENRPDYFLIPDPVFLQSRGYSDIRSHFEVNPVPWEQRTATAFWRGSSSGRPTDRLVGWRSLPRVTLCELSTRYPKLLDAAITQVGQLDASSVQELRKSGLVGKVVPPTDIIRAKYQIDIDGNTNAWAGLFQKLLSGSPVLKVGSPAGYRQWYYDRLRPWINFVPVASDMSDLVEKITWLRTHDAQAREIGSRGRSLALTLDYQSEMTRGMDRITGALRHFGGRAAASLRFGIGRPDNHHLGDGWRIEDKDSAWAVGLQSQIDIPPPFGGGAHVVDLEMSPWPGASRDFGQRVTIAVNGELVQQMAVSSRQTLRCPVPQHALETADSMRITWHHPDARCIASDAFPLDERVVGTRLHGVSVVALSNMSPLPRAAETLPGKAGDETSAFAARAARYRQPAIMRTLYGHDVWRGFMPTRPRQYPIQGWNGTHRAFRLLLEKVTNRTFIDVGAWKGQATVFVAEIMRSSSIDGCVIAVDTFLGGPNHFNQEVNWFHRARGRPDLYETFLENVYYANVTQLVVPLPQTSLAAAAVLRQRQVKAGVVHIDSSPDFLSVMADAEAYWPLIDRDGYLIGDDYHETWPSVIRAAQEFTKKYRLNLEIDTPKWIVQKKL